MLCQHLLYSRVNQLYVYIYPLFLDFLPVQVTKDHRVELPVLYNRFSQCANVNPNLPIQIIPQFIPIHNPLWLKQNMDAHNLWQHSTLSQKFQVMQQSWENFWKALQNSKNKKYYFLTKYAICLLLSSELIMYLQFVLLYILVT